MYIVSSHVEEEVDSDDDASMGHQEEESRRPRRYNPPSEEDVRAALVSRVAGMSMAKAASSKTIKYSTFRDSVRRYAATGSLAKNQRGPKKKGSAAVSDAMRRHLCSYVDDNLTASHEEVYASFEARFGKVISQSRIKAYVQKNFQITMKGHKTLLTLPEAERGAALDKFACLHDLADMGFNSNRSVFVGEMTFDVNGARSYIDEAKQAKRIVKARAAGKSYKPRLRSESTSLEPSLVFLVAFHRKSLLCHVHKICQGAANEDDIKSFLRQTMAKMEEEELRGEWQIVFDDVPDETKAIISEAVKARDHKAVFLPQCFSSLNPVDALMNDAKLSIDRKKVTFEGLLSDAIWHRLTRALNATPETDLQKYILESVHCDCIECI